MFRVPSAKVNIPGAQATNHFAGVTCHLLYLCGQEKIHGQNNKVPHQYQELTMHGQLLVTNPASHGIRDPTKS